MIQHIKKGLSRLLDRGTERTAAYHEKRLNPVFLQVNAFIWGKKRTKELREFNPDANMTLEERLVDVGLLTASTSTALALGGLLFFPSLKLLSVPGLLAGSIPVYKNAYKRMKDEGQISNDFLASLIQTVLIANGNLVLGNLTPLAYFSSRKFSLMSQRRFENTLVSVLSTYQSLSVRVVVPSMDEASDERLADLVECQKPLESLVKDEITVIYAGEMIPVDGTIIQGVGAIDERVLTGESQPVEKGAGTTVFASTLLLSGKLYVQVQSSGQETMIGQVEQILNQTFHHTSARALWAQTFTDALAMPTLVASGITMPFLGVTGALAIINSNPLYRLIIAGNTSLVNFLNITSQESILVKDGRVLEALEEVDTFVFDKTGTLTENQPYVSQIYVFDEHDEQEILFYAAMAEQRQAHPIALAILEAATAQKIHYPDIDTLEYKLGLGLILIWNGQRIYVGSPRFIVTEGIAISADTEEFISNSRIRGVSLVMVAVDHRLIGAIELQTSARPEAAALIAKLRAYPQVKSVLIVSGDHASPTQRLANEIGIEEYYAEVFPEDKAKLIKELQEKGHIVCFVGDGINDSIALKQADVSISLRGASPLATSTAQVVLLDDDLNRVESLLNLSHHFEKNQQLSMALVLGSSGLCLGGVLFLKVKLAQAILITTGGFCVALGVSFGPWLKYRKEISSPHDNLEKAVAPSVSPVELGR